MVTSIIEHFKELPDPRRNQHLVLHKVIDIIVIAMCGTLAQQDTWEEIADYAEMKTDVSQTIFRITQRDSLA